MRKSHRRTVIAAGATLLALFGGFAASAAPAEERGASCRQETKRVAVWPKAPRAASVARFEDRQVTVCDSEVMSRRSPDAALQTNDSGK